MLVVVMSKWLTVGRCCRYCFTLLLQLLPLLGRMGCRVRHILSSKIWRADTLDEFGIWRVRRVITRPTRRASQCEADAERATSRLLIGQLSSRRLSTRHRVIATTE